MLVKGPAVKTIKELVDDGFWLRTALIRYLAREKVRPALKEAISQVIELLMDFHAASVPVMNGETEEVEAKNRQGEKILRTIKIDLAYAGIDIDRLIADCKRDNEAARARKFEGPDPWAV